MSNKSLPYHTIPIVDVHSTVKPTDKCYRLTVIVRCVVFLEHVSQILRN